jgi:putative FmdB family regulatory protein
MPIYEYECKSCGHQQDILQKMSDEALTVCTKCGESTFAKKISAAGFRLKGGGWYETDFKTGKKKNLSSGDSGKSDSGASSSGSNSAA